MDYLLQQHSCTPLLPKDWGGKQRGLQSCKPLKWRVRLEEWLEHTACSFNIDSIES